jgi:hypothetical protein
LRGSGAAFCNAAKLGAARISHGRGPEKNANGGAAHAATDRPGLADVILRGALGGRIGPCALRSEKSRPATSVMSGTIATPTESFSTSESYLTASASGWASRSSAVKCAAVRQ